MFEDPDKYNTQIDIYNQPIGNLDDAGIWHDEPEAVLKTIDCDVQPYSKERAYQDYGFTVECTKRMFCDVDTDLQIGITVAFNNEFYTIQKIVEWDDYYNVLLNNQ